MITLKNWPTLFDKSKNGKLKEWSISTSDNVIVTTHGYVSGKKTQKRKVVAFGKNIGKKNETTPIEQAQSQANSKWKKQKDKGYVENLKDVGKITSYLPMLAKTYVPGKTKLPVSALVQPKLNGVRCIAVKKDGCVRLYSRGQKEYTLTLWDLAKELNSVMSDDDILDGELYVHGWSFERLVSAVKRERLDTYSVEYHVYDKPSERPFKERDRELYSLTFKKFKRLKYVPTAPLTNVKKQHDICVKVGYEGIIIRDANVGYLWKHRGARLLKYKEFIDEEFLVVGYKRGDEDDDGCVVWKCHITGHRNLGVDGYFDVRPTGTVEDRCSLYRIGWRYVGKMLTVRFQERSSKNVPIFPVGISFRDYE